MGSPASRRPRIDPGEEVAQVALARRELMLGVHRFRLRREDLEDCYSQATLELLLAAREGKHFASRAHIANSIELRFLSRVRDRRRALSGRSPMQAAMEGAIPLDDEQLAIEIEDRRSEPERIAILRQELERLRASAAQLTADQRLVLACQISLGMRCEEFCRIHRWTPEKYRKVAQRARARLKRLMELEEPVPTSPRASDQEPGTTL
jgi:DNA-directed RNA polymerase specialized sigma24 family protein